MKQVVSLPSQIGPLLRSARKSAQLTQAEAAQRLGLSQSRLSAIELDPSSLNLAQLLALLSVLGLELQVQPKGGEAAEAPTLHKPEW
jgi:HTH-type transcriptional regulator/antitoxin HipB